MISAVWLLVAAAAPADVAPAPDSATLAVTALLTAGAIPLPPRSGCAGTLPGNPRPTLAALVASRLAYLDAGTNRIGGTCAPGSACTVAITHADGEDVASAEFRFRIARGRLDPTSLRCVFTP